MSEILTEILFNGGFCLISAFITFALGFFVYAQKPSSTVHRLFLAVMVFATYWAAGEYFIWQADSLGEVTFWLKFSSFWPLTIAFSSHFILEFTGSFPRGRMGRIIAACIYLPAVVISFTGLFTDCLFTAGFDPDFGYFYLPPHTNILCLTEIFYTAFIMLWSLGAGFVSWRYTEPGIRHSQNRLLFAGIIIAVFFGALSGIVLPLLQIYIPNLVFIGFVILSILTVYAMWHYGLFVLSFETAVPEIMKTMPDGLILADNKEEIVAANSSAWKIFPSLKDSPERISASSLIPVEDYRTIREILIQKGEISDFEVGPAGVPVRYLSISGSVVKDKEGQPSGAVLIIRDVTGRKESEKALRVANDKLSLLSQLTRHDISNLVTALSGYLSFLDETVVDSEGRRYLEKTHEITDLIIKQIEFSRSYQDIGSEEPRWKELEGLIDEARKSLIGGDIKILVDVGGICVYADPLLEKVFFSLIENAVRHGGKVTEIVISAEGQKDESLILKVKDNGSGIPDDEKEKIFVYGYGKNTGFGLAFARELLSVTGIEISEKGVFGEGACFEIYIPKGAWKKA